MGALDAIYERAHESLRSRSLLGPRRARFQVWYYPYAGLRSVIYRREGHYEVRLADLLEQAPLDVHYSLACILLSKIDRRLRLSRAERRAYDSWSRRPEIAALHETTRRERGKKVLDPPEGRHHNLIHLYHRVNVDYFGGRLPPVQLGWSRRGARSIWGHHDDAHRAIVLNRLLDSPRVPSFVVESVLHHEMLHHDLGARLGRTGRRILHSREFRRLEKGFAHYEEANRFLQAVADRKIRLRETASSS